MKSEQQEEPAPEPLAEREPLLETIREERDKLRSLVESIADAIWFLNGDGEIYFVNTAALEHVSLPREEVQGRSYWEFLTALQVTDAEGRPLEPQKSALHRALQGQSFRNFEYSIRYPGQDAPLYREASATPLRDKDGQISGAVAVIRDVTARKRLETELIAHRQQLQALVDERTAELEARNQQLQAEIYERQRAEHELTRRNRELALLHVFMSRAGSSLDVEGVVMTLQELLRQRLHIPGGGFWRYSTGRDELILLSQWGFPEEVADPYRRLLVEGSIFERVIREQDISRRDVVRDEPAYQALGLPSTRPEWQSYLALPIVNDDQVLGLICLFTQAPEHFSEEQVIFFSTLGRELGTLFQNARLYEQVHHGRERLRKLSQRIVSGQERERHRVARELHDEAGQALIGLKLGLQMIQSDLSQSDHDAEERQGAAQPEDGRAAGRRQGDLASLQERLANAIELSDATMDRIRRLAHDLSPSAVEDLGVHLALEGVANDFAGRTDLLIEYSGVEIPDLPYVAGVALYRVLQEALTNVVEHARASEVQVQLNADADTVSLTVEDNGQGFEPAGLVSDWDRYEGIGIAGMMERLQALGGGLIIDSQPEKGTRLVARVPR